MRVFIPEFQQKMKSEIELARANHGPMRSLHEALAVILEEFDELKAEVFRKNVNIEDLEAELVSVATMCQRMYEDVIVPLRKSASESVSPG